MTFEPNLLLSMGLRPVSSCLDDYGLCNIFFRNLTRHDFNFHQVHTRIPICNSASPLECDFDAICKAMLGTNVNCPIIVNCQVVPLTRFKSYDYRML